MRRIAIITATCAAMTIQAHTAELWRIGDDDWALITISGRIEPGDDVAFLALSSRTRHAVVMLNSNGGRLMPALRLGNAVRAKGYLTAASSKCVSACALIWLAGSERVMFPVSIIGFHAAYYEKPDGGVVIHPQGVALTAAYIARLGLGDDVVRMTTGDPDRMELLSKKRADDIGLQVTMLGDPADTAEVIR